MFMHQVKIKQMVAALQFPIAMTTAMTNDWLLSSFEFA